MSEKSKKMKVTALSGHQFEVDISDEAIAKAGGKIDGQYLKHGDRIYDKKVNSGGVVMGVASIFEWAESGEKVIWYALDHDGGLVGYGSEFKKYVKKLNHA